MNQKPIYCAILAGFALMLAPTAQAGSFKLATCSKNGSPCAIAFTYQRCAQWGGGRLTGTVKGTSTRVSGSGGLGVSASGSRQTSKSVARTRENVEMAGECLKSSARFDFVAGSDAVMKYDNSATNIKDWTVKIVQVRHVTGGREPDDPGW